MCLLSCLGLFSLQCLPQKKSPLGILKVLKRPLKSFVVSNSAHIERHTWVSFPLSDSQSWPTVWNSEDKQLLGHLESWGTVIWADGPIEEFCLQQCLWKSCGLRGRQRRVVPELKVGTGQNSTEPSVSYLRGCRWEQSSWGRKKGTGSLEPPLVRPWCSPLMKWGSRFCFYCSQLWTWNNF